MVVAGGLKFEQGNNIVVQIPSRGHASKKLKTLSEASNYVIWVHE